jgi:trimethylamine:corrinoid methyltransferase-like protein
MSAENFTAAWFTRFLEQCVDDTRTRVFSEQQILSHLEKLRDHWDLTDLTIELRVSAPDDAAERTRVSSQHYRISEQTSKPYLVWIEQDARQQKYLVIVPEGQSDDEAHLLR